MLEFVLEGVESIVYAFALGGDEVFAVLDLSGDKDAGYL